jgi:hypothetical protein
MHGLNAPGRQPVFEEGSCSCTMTVARRGALCFVRRTRDVGATEARPGLINARRTGQLLSGPTGSPVG